MSRSVFHLKDVNIAYNTGAPCMPELLINIHVQEVLLTNALNYCCCIQPAIKKDVSISVTIIHLSLILSISIFYNLSPLRIYFCIIKK